jgi:hypothetical protein
MAKIAEHKDILGQPINEGNYVAISHRNTMYICQIMKLSAKMMRVVPVGKKHYGADGFLIYPDQSVLLSGTDALAYILTHAGS